MWWERLKDTVGGAEGITDYVNQLALTTYVICVAKERGKEIDI